MPESRSRPLSSVRFGDYDNPPSNTESNPPPYPNRLMRLQRALRNTVDLARPPNADGQPSTEPQPRYTAPPVPPMSRRRQRSPSYEEDDESNQDHVPISSLLEDNRHRYSDARRRLAKRRRLDVDCPPVTRPPIKYGYYGQVEPGRLNLEIVSCTGGEHTDPRSPDTYLGPFNILKSDKSVYCSERDSASFVLRHADDTPFCLDKLHIVGPEHGFTAPVREGIVYVAMTLQELQKYQDPPLYARRAGVDTPPYVYCPRRNPHNFPRRRSPERLSLTDALRDPEINAAYDDGVRFADELRNLDVRDTSVGEEDNESEPEDELQCDRPSHIRDDNHYATPAQRRPVTLINDDEPDHEDTSSQEILDYRLQRMRHANQRREAELWNNEDRWHVGFSTAYRFSDSIWGRERSERPWPQRLPYAARAPRAHNTADVTSAPSAARDMGSASEQSELRNSYDTRNDQDSRPTPDSAVTTARFHIQRGKYKVTIKFDPPVSGRFLLLKMHACGSKSSNVDVQSVVAKGFAGPRFFPAMQPR